MMISIESSLGIQLDHESVSLAFLKKFLQKVELDCYDVISVPEGTPEKERDDFLARAISSILRGKHINTDNVWVGLPRNETLLRLLTLPAAAEENLAEVVRYEVGKYISFPLEEIVYDFSVVAHNLQEKTLRLLLVIARRTTFQRAFSILEKAGLQPLGMEVNTTALLNLAFSKKNGNGAKNAVALVQVGKRDFETTWVHDGVLRYSHVSAFSEQGEAGRSAQVLREIRSGFRAAFSFQQCNGQGGMNSAEIYLIGEADADELVTEMKSTPDVTVSTFPMNLLTRHVSLPASSVPQAAAPVIGLALRGLKKVPYTINLLPRNLRRKTKKTGIYFSIIIFFVVIMLTVAWSLSSVVKNRLVLHKIEQEIAALKHEVQAIQEIQAEAESAEKMMAGIEMAEGREASNLTVLKELSTIVPPTVWLTNLRYHKSSLQLSGYAESSSDLIAILDGSPLFDSSEFTAPITRDRQGAESFKIKTTIEKK